MQQRLRSKSAFSPRIPPMKFPLWFLAIVLLAPSSGACAGEKKARLPNILWVTCEDLGPNLGCYGDKYATSPNIDRLAARGSRYRVAWSNAPVCAPARTTIISGLYPPSTGAEHMRSMTKLPASMQMFPVYLRRLGYYCTNRDKEDYNLQKTGQVWDDSSKKAHWKNRKPGQPFFAVFNFVGTHESQIRRRPHTLVHDPAKAPLSPYYPDTPEVRHDWAQYYDNITEMDRQVGAVLRELEEAGLAEETIVFFYSDHGAGMPRHKRTPCDSGLHVPMIVHVPERYRDLAAKDYVVGGESRRLVSFVDLAPTMLSLAGLSVPDVMQGAAFMGPREAAPREYLYGFRGRMDERYNLVRSVRDQRYVYVRCFLPHRPQGQHNSYMFEMPTARVWKQLFDQGKLTPAQQIFWQPQAPEQLYDLDTDPAEVRNLAGLPEHQDTVRRFRRVQREHFLKIRDVGFLPEDEIHSRSVGSTPYEMGHDEAKYPLKRVLETAELASLLRPEDTPRLVQALADSDSAVRYWGAEGLIMRGKDAVAAAHSPLTKALADPAPAVRIAAAEALGRFGGERDVKEALTVLTALAPVRKNGAYISLEALNALGNLGSRAAPALPVIRAAAEGGAPGRAGAGVGSLVRKIVADLTR
jgi:arylsulfatase A-like enzyme